jgi:hypothetical protein
MNTRFIALHCGDETAELLANHPTAFLLHTQIAMRAKWKDCTITKLKAGQAFIGDYQAAGIHSEMAYRHAKAILSDCGLATFKGTNKGTIATLVNSTIYSLSPYPSNERGNDQATDKERSRNDQGTTNHTDTRKTQTHLALNGASSDPAPEFSWNASEGFAGITDADRQGWAEAFPAVNINRQLAAASEWLKANPAKRKTKIRRFITGWLSRQQEKGGDIPSNPVSSAPAGTIIAGGRVMRS